MDPTAASKPLRAQSQRWLSTLIGGLAVLLPLWSAPSWAEEIQRLFIEIEDPHRLGRIIEHNAADVARNASFARRYRIVEVNTDLLSRDEPFFLNLFDDVSILVETIEWSVGANEFHRTWRGRILGLGQSTQHVEVLRRELIEQDPPPGVPAGFIEKTLLEVNASSSSFDIDADTGIANLSGQRRFGRVRQNGPGDQMSTPQSPWRLVHEAFRSVRISQVFVPRSGEIVTYSVSPLKWSPKYHMIIEIDPDRVANNIANPSQRKALIEEGLQLERSLPSEEGKVMMGEIK